MTLSRRWRRYPVAALVVLLANLVHALPAAAETVEGGQWYVDFLDLDSAHKISQGRSVTVAIIDSGVGVHPDLAGRVLSGTDARVGGNDPDGRNDEDGHGTGMAGLVVGHGRVRGVAPAATVLPVKISNGVGYASLAPGIEWAIDHGATVISISLGVSRSGISDEMAVRRAIEAGVVVVASVGNTDEDHLVAYPAAYDGVVAVGGVDREGNHAKISVRSDRIVLAAPSDKISVTEPNGKYTIATGTSNSTALVAGAVALVRAKFPDLSAEEVIHRLTYTADDKGPTGRDDEYGYGVVNIVKALTADVPPLHPQTTPSYNDLPDVVDDDPPIALIVLGAVLALLLVVILVLLLRRRRT
ncbi:type VII secretion-associated serine protease mycosin [Luedemannella flava]|uniref:Type VII secretion-associated serine protease mycosin n=2 Tax=Luedemannella flava TaxID=349316 RepID=A0ABP4Y287_9ACTN